MGGSKSEPRQMLIVEKSPLHLKPLKERYGLIQTARNKMGNKRMRTRGMRIPTKMPLLMQNSSIFVLASGPR